MSSITPTLCIFKCLFVLGPFCEELGDLCASQPCLNGGVCQYNQSGYVCSCPSGFLGHNCEIDINECSSRPCQNRGTCIDLPNVSIYVGDPYLTRELWHYSIASQNDLGWKEHQNMIYFQLLCSRQRPVTLHQVAESSIQPDLEHYKRWGIYNFLPSHQFSRNGDVWDDVRGLTEVKANIISCSQLLIPYPSMQLLHR